MTEQLTEPLPCPFCGGKAITVKMAFNGWHVECHADGCPVQAETIEYVTCEAAVAAWNTRAPDPQSAAPARERDELRAAAELALCEIDGGTQTQDFTEACRRRERTIHALRAALAAAGSRTRGEGEGKT